jgi:hypothetical protein
VLLGEKVKLIHPDNENGAQNQVNKMIGCTHLFINQRVGGQFSIIHHSTGAPSSAHRRVITALETGETGA